MIIPETGTPQSQREQTLRLHIGTAQGGGLGQRRGPCSASWSLSWSRMMPGSTTQVRFSGSTETRSWQYLAQSIITAALVPCPARLVPPPRGEHRHVVRTADRYRLGPGLDVRGTTTAMGSWRSPSSTPHECRHRTAPPRRLAS